MTNIQQLSVSKRILLAEELWDSIRNQADEIKLTPEQMQLLDERLAFLKTDGELGDSWTNVKTRVTKAS